MKPSPLPQVRCQIPGKVSLNISVQLYHKIPMFGYLKRAWYVDIASYALHFANSNYLIQLNNRKIHSGSFWLKKYPFYDTRYNEFQQPAKFTQLKLMLPSKEYVKRNLLDSFHSTFCILRANTLKFAMSGITDDRRKKNFNFPISCYCVVNCEPSDQCYGINKWY